jgi:hypothetical protein
MQKIILMAGKIFENRREISPFCSLVFLAMRNAAPICESSQALAGTPALRGDVLD